MWLGRYCPGLQITPEKMEQMSPEMTHALRRAGQKLVNRDVEFQFNLAKLVATAASGVRFR